MYDSRPTLNKTLEELYYIKLYNGIIGYKDLSLLDAIVFCYLIDQYCGKLKHVPELGRFYCTAKQVKKATGVCETSQKRCFKKLTAAGLLDVVVLGFPPKRYFRFNVEGVKQMKKEYLQRLQTQGKTPQSQEGLIGLENIGN